MAASSIAGIRVIQDGAAEGAVNMARDEALMVRVGQGRSAPTLRLYRWDPPTISLGYFQRFEDYRRLAKPAGDLAVVRRPTGGGAILHDLELTYALTLPLDHPLPRGGPNTLYEKAHDAVIACLRELGVEGYRGGPSDDSGAAKGPFFCFARRHRFDVLVGPDKLAGSAQRRTREALLQHGSILVGNRFPQQPAARLALDVESTIETLRARFVEALARGADHPFYPGAWLEEELQDARRLTPKYADPDWTERL